MSSTGDILDNVVVVLHCPRTLVNIGGVVRVLKNMGLRALRLVDAPPFEASDITSVAHRSEDILASLQRYEDLDTALADMHYVVGTTARVRGDCVVRDDVRTLASEICGRAVSSRVALLFGPEDVGLDNHALDRCNTVVRLPADPAYPSLNLAQAVLLLAYEVRMAALADMGGTSRAIPIPGDEETATASQRETLFGAVEQALWAIEFFKSGQTVRIMRMLRNVIKRANPDEHEVALLTAIARETVHGVRRIRG